MGKVITIAPKGIRAAAGDGMPTYWLGGIVGLDFTGAQLSAEVGAACKHYGECKLIIDSVGGLASDAFTFYDYVRVNGLKVWAEGYGTVASAATVLMAAAGRNRSSLAPNAEYLVHEASGGDDESSERYNARLADVYAELSGKTAKEWRAIMKEDKAQDAQWAKKMKLVGEVLEHERIAAQLKAMEDVKDALVVDWETKDAEGRPKVTDANGNVLPVEEAAKHYDLKDDPTGTDGTGATEEVEQEIPVTVPQAIEAAMRGHITAKVKVGTEMRQAVAALTEEVKEVKAKLDEASSEAEGLREKLTASEDARAKAEAKVKEQEDGIKSITAELEKIKSEPLTPAKEVKAEKEVQVPGAGPSIPSREKGRSSKLKNLEAETEEAFARFNKNKA